MKIIFYLCLFNLISFNLSASCKKDFIELQNKKEVSLVDVREIEIKTRKDLSRLSPEELRAVDNYIEYLDFKFGKENTFDDNSLYVKTREYQSKNESKSLLGFKVSVTDGGDESNVNYYISLKNNTNYVILYRTWDNQSPERDWLCEPF